jgi:hypothetical protein
MLQSLIMSLETQFDSVIVDRPMVLQSLYQLHNCHSDRKILTWEFFLNRFDALFLEAQINLEKSGDIAYLRGRIYNSYSFCNFIYVHEHIDVCIIVLLSYHSSHERASKLAGVTVCSSI